MSFNKGSFTNSTISDKDQLKFWNILCSLKKMKFKNLNLGKVEWRRRLDKSEKNKQNNKDRREKNRDVPFSNK
jgi:hypothetical protein